MGKIDELKDENERLTRGLRVANNTIDRLKKENESLKLINAGKVKLVVENEYCPVGYQESELDAYKRFVKEKDIEIDGMQQRIERLNKDVNDGLSENMGNRDRIITLQSCVSNLTAALANLDYYFYKAGR